MSARVLAAVVLILLFAAQPAAAATTAVDIIAINDFHGALEPPHQAVIAPRAGGGTMSVPAGGAAYLASAINDLRAKHPDSIVVGAGDLIGATPLTSGLFLDEPAIEALNLMHLDVSSVGNHEFEKGPDELLRMAHGGCAKFTVRQPCRLEPGFTGARFQYLAANVRDASGQPMFPASVVRTVGQGDHRVRIGFIGVVVRGTAAMISPGVAKGLTFGDEADAANAQIPALRRQGVDAIVLLIHEGGATSVTYNDKSCAGFKGDLLPILARLDPAIDVVVSAHTHRAYVCDYGRTDPKRPFLVTSAGNNGVLVTDIRLGVDRTAHRVVSKSADNLIVQSEGYSGPDGPVALTDQYRRYPPDPVVAALVARYAAAAAPLASRIVGHIDGAATRRANPAGETSLGDLIADADLAATRAPEAGGARIAFSNAAGLRADLVPGPGGAVTYAQTFAVQPFNNVLMVRSFTGRQIIALLEQQFDRPGGGALHPLSTSAGMTYSYDLTRPHGAHVRDARIDGAPIDPDAVYRVATNSFLAGGGEGFTGFEAGTGSVETGRDVDALAAYLAGGVVVPATGRVRDLTAR